MKKTAKKTKDTLITETPTVIKLTTNGKNPWAIAVGSRLQQARQMAEFSNIDQLLQQLPKQWHKKRSRFTNYEAGISLIPPEIVELVAEATHCSACWIMFGTGPIRDNGRNTQAVRHQNLVFKVEEIRKQKKLGSLYKEAGLSKHKIEDYLNDPFKQIEEKLSKKLEKYFKLSPGWMDEQHIANDPICNSFPDDLRELMTLYSNASEEKRQMLLKLARTVTE